MNVYYCILQYTFIIIRADRQDSRQEQRTNDQRGRKEGNQWD